MEKYLFFLPVVLLSWNTEADTTNYNPDRGVWWLYWMVIIIGSAIKGTYEGWSRRGDK